MPLTNEGLLPGAEAGAKDAVAPPDGKKPDSAPPAVKKPDVAPPAQDPGVLTAKFQQLETSLSERDKEISTLKEVIQSAESKAAGSASRLTDIEGQLKEKDSVLARVLTAYRISILENHPDIPEEMISGSTLDELQTSLSKAATLVKKIREKAPSAPGIPAGAPVRSGPDFAAMSSREKIVQGLRK